MKTLFALALTVAALAGTLALAASFPPNEFSSNAPPANTNRVMSITDTDWRAMPPPGVSFMTGGVGRVTAPAPQPSPAAAATTR